jgi:Domain of unknown function (DUF4296)
MSICINNLLKVLKKFQLYVFLLTYGLIFWQSCSPKNGKRPENLISKSKMANILADIHLMEGEINNFGIPNTDTTSFLFRKFQANILAKHQIDTSAFNKSYKYYLINPEDFTDIYTDVVSIIEKRNKIDSTARAKIKKTIADPSRVKKDTALKSINKNDSIKLPPD